MTGWRVCKKKLPTFRLSSMNSQVGEMICFIVLNFLMAMRYIFHYSFLASISSAQAELSKLGSDSTLIAQLEASEAGVRVEEGKLKEIQKRIQTQGRRK